jgi:outer membrane protein assembly factor BamB
MFRALLLSGLLAVASLAAADDWATFRHDAARTGAASSAGPTEAAVDWSADLGGSVDGSPIVVGGRIYVGNSHGEFFALSRGDGTPLWKATTGGAIVGAAEVAGDVVTIASVDCFLYAFDAQTGQLRWRHRADRPALAGATYTGGKLLFGAMDGVLRALDPTTGKALWTAPGQGGISSPVAVQDDAVFYGDEGGNLYARKLADGSQLWTQKLSGRVIAAPTIAEGKLLVPLMSLTALTPPECQYLTAWSLDGQKLWNAKPGAMSLMATPLPAFGTTWCFTVEGYTSDGVLRGFRVADGLAVAELKMGRQVVDSAMSLAGETAFLASENGTIYFLNARTGGVQRTLRLGGNVFSSPAVADGRLYVGCQDGKLYCVK